ncbi:MAG: hypothetical protein HY093_02780 [Candidatus Liptonbacteria bacterium]|nr:hypothetical protein [Candidatus Liptonbacteria bacterium]
MTKIQRGITVALLASQLLVPLLVLAQPAGAAPDIRVAGSDIKNLCGVVALIERIANVLLVVLIILAVIFVIMAAFKYLTAGGDAEKVSAANKQILYAAIAVAVGLLARAVPFIVQSIIANGVDCAQAISNPLQ